MTERVLPLLLFACSDAAQDPCCDALVDTAVERETGDDSGATHESDSVAPDVDGDGWTLEGGDCDDTRADVYPGAREWCDPVDHDCDGAPLAEGVCGEEQQTANIQSATWIGDEPDDGIGWPVAAGDLDGDGIDDFLVQTGDVSRFSQGWATGAFAAVLGGGPLGDDLPLFDSAVAYWAGEPEQADWLHFIGAGFPAGDFDGDGFGDLMFLSRGCVPDEGAAYLILGPPERWPTDGAYLADVADGRWLEANDSECFGNGGAAGGDLDGDGLNDVVIHTLGLAEDGSDGVFTVLRGGSELPAGRPRDAETNVLLASSDGNNPNTAWVRMSEDLDGDGLAEVLFDVWDGYRVVAGDEFAAADGLHEDEVGVLVESYSFDARGSLGDWDGDGAADWAVGFGHEWVSDSSGEIRILRAPDLQASSVSSFDLEIGSFYGDRADAAVGASMDIIPDMDGDGRREITGFQLMENGYQGGWCVFPSTRFGPGAHDAREASWCHTSTTRTGKGMPGGDFDGDGRTDLILGYGAEADERGRVHLVLGWDLPWDDPYYW